LEGLEVPAWGDLGLKVLGLEFQWAWKISNHFELTQKLDTQIHIISSDELLNCDRLGVAIMRVSRILEECACISHMKQIVLRLQRACKIFEHIWIRLILLRTQPITNAVQPRLVDISLLKQLILNSCWQVIKLLPVKLLTDLGDF